MPDLSTIQQISIWILPILFAVTLHEAAHAWVAFRCGDTTAKMFGRLTFNPIKHIDLIGTIIIPIVVLLLSEFHYVFGWAKPVPINSALMRNPRRDLVLTTAAGPISNLIMAFIWASCLKIALLLNPLSSNTFLFLLLTARAGIIINLLLAFFNLLPIPPLDGGRIAIALLPARQSSLLAQLEPYGFFILLTLLLTGIMGWLLNPLLTGSFYFLKFIFSL